MASRWGGYVLATTAVAFLVHKYIVSKQDRGSGDREEEEEQDEFGRMRRATASRGKELPNDVVRRIIILAFDFVYSVL